MRWLPARRCSSSMITTRCRFSTNYGASVAIEYQKREQGEIVIAFKKLQSGDAAPLPLR